MMRPVRLAGMLALVAGMVLAGCLKESGETPVPIEDEPMVEKRPLSASCSVVEASVDIEARSLAEEIPEGYEVSTILRENRDSEAAVATLYVTTLECGVASWGNQSVDSFRLSMLRVPLYTTPHGSNPEGYDDYLIEAIADGLPEDLVFENWNPTSWPMRRGTITVGPTLVTIEAEGLAYRIETTPGRDAPMASASSYWFGHQWLHHGAVEAQVTASWIYEGGEVEENPARFDVQGGVLAGVRPVQGQWVGVADYVSGDTTWAPLDRTAETLLPEVPAVAASAPFLQECQGKEAWLAADEESARALLPPGYQPGWDPFETAYPVPFWPEDAPGARARVMVLACDVVVDGEVWNGVRFAWTGILVDEVPGSRRDAGGWDDHDDFVFESFVDGAPTEAVKAWREAGWHLQDASIQEQGSLRIAQADRVLYDIELAEGVFVATCNCFLGERFHQMTADGADWWDFEGYMNRYDPQAACTAQVVEGALAGLTVAGSSQPPWPCMWTPVTGEGWAFFRWSNDQLQCFRDEECRQSMGATGEAAARP